MTLSDRLSEPPQWQSSLWDHFHKFKKRYYKEDTSHKAAWCRGCVKNEIEGLEKQDELAVIHGERENIRSEDELFETAIAKIEPIRGKLETLEGHLKKCKHIDAADVKIALEKRKIELETHHNKENGHSAPSASHSPPTTPSRSRHTTAIHPDSPVAKRQRLADHPIPIDELQREFSDDFLRLLVANRLAWNAADHPETLRFMRKWCPEGLRVPHRRMLGGPLLKKAVAVADKKVKGCVQGQLATGESDGWKDTSKTPVSTTMMTVNNESYLVRTHNLSGQRKDGNNLYDIILDDKTYMEKSFLVELIAWITDDGPDGKKARRLLSEKFGGRIIVSVCWAHQINLIVGDYLKKNPQMRRHVQMAILVIEWFRAHDLPRHWLNQEQLSNDTHALVLILPVVTRWMYHYLSVSRLLAVSGALRALVFKRADDLVECAGRKDDDKEKAEKVLGIVEDPEFWDCLRKVQAYLEPLAIANNVAQAAHTRFDHILISLGNLYRIYSDPKLERVYGRKADVQFWEATNDYYHSQGDFSDDGMSLAFFEESCKQRDEEVDVVQVWRALEDRNTDDAFNGRQGFIKLAIRILSIVANSASCERSFTKFGNVHTKLRNRLSSTHDITTVSMDIDRDHANAKRKRPKRKFGDIDSSQPSLPPSTPELLPQESDEFAAQDLLDPEHDATDFGLIADRLCADAEAQSADTEAAYSTYKFSQIPLSDVFIYPSWNSGISAQPGSILEHFWKGGVRSVELEMDLHAALWGDDDGVDKHSKDSL